MARVVAAMAAAACIGGAQERSIDDAFASFWAASTVADAAKAASAIGRSGIGFDAAFARLRQGRAYSGAVPTGIIERRHDDFGYVLDVPEHYDAGRRYAVRFQLHGGVMGSRENGERRGRAGIARLRGAEQIYVLPAGWHDAPWWTAAQIENLRTILDSLKRTYNVDENHVVVAGVSDGATGAYYVAMRDTTPYASFLPLNGFIGVLNNPDLRVDGDLFPGNLRNKPLFVVNGGRDPLYPVAAVEPYVEHLARGGVAITYRPQPQAGHETSWWPDVKDSFEAFVRDHPRDPYPDRLTWATTDPRQAGRAHWLVIDALGGPAPDTGAIDDLNDFTPPPQLEIGLRIGAGLRVDRVIPRSMAVRLGVREGDVLEAIGETRVADGPSLARALQAYALHAPISIGVLRGDQRLTLSGTFDPEVVVQPHAPIFRHTKRAGRVDLVKSGNTVEAVARGVREFTLLLSPDRFDFAQPIKVVVNGRLLHDARLDPSVATLLEWAARDNDRTMLFGAAIKLTVPRP